MTSRVTTTHFPPATRERAHRRALAVLGRGWKHLEVAIDRLTGPALNPLYHTGTIAVFSLAVATVSGIYLFLFYRVGTEAAHQSIEGIMAHPLGIGALMRSLHRYSSDAAILAALLHGLKMLLDDRFTGPRWIGWVTGWALVALVWVTGATGYWLVWDAQALVLSVTTARLLDVLPFFAEPIVQTFQSNETIQKFLFFIVLFVHITIPLLLGGMYWLHVMRLARAKFMPPRIVLGLTGLAMLIVSIVRPALSGPPADPAVIVTVVPIDWFYFPYFPLTALDPRIGWAIVAGTGAVLMAMPWLFRQPLPRARVTLDACTGCTRCYKDCPYDAIVMSPRSDGTRFRFEAVVNPARCVGCGICVGACDTGGIVLGGEPVQVLTAVVAERLSASRETGDRPIVLYTCRLMTALQPSVDEHGRLADGTVVMGVPCVGLLHPDIIRKTIELGARGVYVAGCHPDDCQAREGSRWLAERLSGARLPKLRDVESAQVALRGYAPVEARRLRRDLTAFRGSLS
jgi:quinol-cytochrome oxidoreductase complex cytochrome b subunit/Fe-S-cluster-containing hydrogenase component 2